MKKHHIILVCSIIFTLLFYNESVGVNLSIFGLLLIGIISYFYKHLLNSRSHLILVATSVVSCFAFAWYGDFVSFLALATSIIILQFQTQESYLKIIQAFPIVFINGFTSLVRMFMFNQWIPKREKNNDLVKKLIAYLFIPALFVGLFVIVYAFGSDHFSALFTNYYLNINSIELILITILGFYISFSFWNYWIPNVCHEKNVLLENEFNSQDKLENKNTFSFLDIDFERKSGEITFVLLNILLVIFIITYNYEQFFEVTQKSNLSEATHERVNVVIFSIIMAVGVIMFYFKSGFNFDEKAKNLKKLSKIWMLLNGILIISTIIKNSEYISYYGLTYKRLGVYAFLTLALISLFYTFTKITKQKTNAYLINQMVWYFYGTLLLCSFVNWGGCITVFNTSINKGVEPEFLKSLNYNEEYRNLYFTKSIIPSNNHSELNTNVEYQKNKSFLSKALYYDFLNEK